MRYNDEKSDAIKNQVYKAYLCRYPRYTIITYDCGNELFGHAFKINLAKNEYIINSKYTTTENPQANCILERINQVIANLVCTFHLKNNFLEKEDPRKVFYQILLFSEISMYHTMLQAMTNPLVFGRAMVFNSPFILNYE